MWLTISDYTGSIPKWDWTFDDGLKNDCLQGLNNSFLFQMRRTRCGRWTLCMIVFGAGDASGCWISWMIITGKFSGLKPMWVFRRSESLVFWTAWKSREGCRKWYEYNGPELISLKLDLWCRDNGVTLAFIQPGKPTQNAFIERFNRTLRNEVLNAYVFKTINDVRDRMENFIFDYNHNRPHDSLGNQTPMQLYQKHESLSL